MKAKTLQQLGRESSETNSMGGYPSPRMIEGSIHISLTPMLLEIQKARLLLKMRV